MQMEVIIAVIFFVGVLLIGLGLPWIGYVQEKRSLPVEQSDAAGETSSE